MPTPEEQARENIDALLERCGWQVQDKSSVNLQAARGVAVRELSFKTGEPDYTLFVDGKAIGTIEAKPVGHSLIGVEEQLEKYVKGVPFGLPAWRSPLAEQHFIVERVERRLSLVEETALGIEANVRRSESLRQSVLRQAFSGDVTKRIDVTY